MTLRRIRLIATLTVMLSASPFASQISDIDRTRSKQMFRQFIDEIRKKYFDPTFGGRDLNSIEARGRPSV